MRFSVLRYLQRQLACPCRTALQQRRYITHSTLVSAFNVKKKKAFNLFSKQETGLFGIAELTNASGFKILEERCLADIDRLIEEVLSPDRSRKLIVILDEMSNSICKVADMCEFVRQAHPNNNIRIAAEDSYMTLIDVVEKLNTNVAIHDALQSVMDNGDVVQLSDMDRRVTNLMLQDFKQCGIHLDDERREKFVALNNTVQRLSDVFQQECSEATNFRDVRMPEDLRKSYHFERGRSMNIDMDKASENDTEMAREGIYRIYLSPRSGQEALLSDMLEGRRLMAEVTGYESFAQRTLQGTLMETQERTMQFLESMAEEVRKGAAKEYKEMLNRKLALSEYGEVVVRHNKIMPWDPPYFTNQQKRDLYDAESVSEYLSLGNCIDGLNTLFKQLFGITLENVDSPAGELWEDSVYKLAVTDEKEGILGYIYCDLFERKGKANQDCLFTIQGGKLLESGQYQLPIVVLHLHLPNFYRTPPLMAPANVENLFHEFGHAIHSMVGRTHYQHVAGTRCPIDFAEVPSVLMEYFTWDKRVVETFAKHYKTGYPMEQAELTDFLKSRRVFMYSDIQLQICYSILDQIYHGKNFAPKTPTDVLRETMNKYHGIPYLENTCWHHRFNHLSGYGARYYSYLVSRAVASKIWRDLFEKDPFNRESGELYRRKMLSFGGEKHPSELIEDLLGEKPTVEFLVESLAQDLKSRAIKY